VPASTVGYNRERRIVGVPEHGQADSGHGITSGRDLAIRCGGDITRDGSDPGLRNLSGCASRRRRRGACAGVPINKSTVGTKCPAVTGGRIEGCGQGTGRSFLGWVIGDVCGF